MLEDSMDHLYSFFSLNGMDEHPFLPSSTILLFSSCIYNITPQLQPLSPLKQSRTLQQRLLLLIHSKYLNLDLQILWKYFLEFLDIHWLIQSLGILEFHIYNLLITQFGIQTNCFSDITNQKGDFQWLIFLTSRIIFAPIKYRFRPPPK